MLFSQQRQEAFAPPAVTVPCRKVRATVKGLAVRREPDAHGPAPAPSQDLHRAHVDGIDIRSLFAIDLDGDVVLVDVARDLFVLEALFFHHMAPVTGGVADTEEHRPVQSLGQIEGFVSPWKPIDRVVGVLCQIGAGFEDQPIRVFGDALIVLVLGAGHVVLTFGFPRLLQSRLEGRVAVEQGVDVAGIGRNGRLLAAVGGLGAGARQQRHNGSEKYGRSHGARI